MNSLCSWAATILAVLGLAVAPALGQRGGNEDLLGSTKPSMPPIVVHSADGKCEIDIDVSGAPDLKEWAETKLAPTLAEWYPKIAEMLPSEGYEPPDKFTVTIRDGGGVAATGGTRVTANARWLRGELKREAVGALVHEEVHVIQQYPSFRRAAGATTRNRPATQRGPTTRGARRGGGGGGGGGGSTGWLVEGIADYIRWYKYEPQSHGADRFNPKTVKYNDAYRPTANFLNYVTEKYDKDIVKELNAALRDGKYNDDLWKQHTGKAVQELGEEWKANLPSGSPRPGS